MCDRGSCADGTQYEAGVCLHRSTETVYGTRGNGCGSNRKLANSLFLRSSVQCCERFVSLFGVARSRRTHFSTILTLSFNSPSLHAVVRSVTLHGDVLSIVGLHRGSSKCLDTFRRCIAERKNAVLLWWVFARAYSLLKRTVSWIGNSGQHSLTSFVAERRVLAVRLSVSVEPMLY